MPGSDLFSPAESYGVTAGVVRSSVVFVEAALRKVGPKGSRGKLHMLLFSDLRGCSMLTLLTPGFP